MLDLGIARGAKYSHVLSFITHGIGEWERLVVGGYVEYVTWDDEDVEVRGSARLQ